MFLIIYYRLIYMHNVLSPRVQSPINGAIPPEGIPLALKVVVIRHDLATEEQQAFFSNVCDQH